MTIFQAVNKLEPDISLSFDEEKQLYLCKMLSRSGYHELDGPDINSITYQIEAIIREEYTDLVRSISKEKENRSGNSRSQSSSKKKLDSFTIASLVPHFSFGSDMGFLEGLSGIFSSSAKNKLRKKLFSASVGGVLIFAGSRKALRKKLAFKRNKLIQQIMHSVRMSKITIERSIVARKFEASKRIREKRNRADSLSPLKWNEIHKDKSSNSWGRRIIGLKTRIQDRKSRSIDLWSGK